MLASHATHLPDGRSQETTKGTGHGGSRKEDGRSNPKLASLIPTREIIVDSREQTSFGQTEEKPRSHQSLVVMDQAHGHHDDAPHGHNQGNEDARSQALEEDVREGFGQGVRDEEDGEGGVVLAVCHVEILLQAIQFRIPDVGSVEETDEVEETEPRDQSQVEFPEEFLVLRTEDVNDNRPC